MKLQTVFLLLWVPLSLHAAIIAQSNDISASTTWNADTILVTGNITIEASAALTIEPGTWIMFDDAYAITVQGRILANGTSDKRITFSARDSAVGWKGIRFVQPSSQNDSSFFKYCTFEYGKTTGSSPGNCGGAIFISDFSKIAISHATFQNCSASGYESNGGAIFCKNASPSIDSCIFCYNRAGWNGGAVACTDGSTPRINMVNFNNNRCDGVGGAIYCSNASPLLTAIIVSSCFAGDGSGLYCDNSSPVIRDATFNENGFSAAGVRGGAIFCENQSSPDIKQTIIHDNIASWGGGIYCNYESNPRLDNVIFMNNKASIGGAVFCDGASPLIISCEIVKNHASKQGGGIYCQFSSSPEIVNGTIAYNSTDSVGGGVLAILQSRPVFTNTILWTNTTKGNCDEITIADTTSNADIRFCTVTNGKNCIHTVSNEFTGVYANNLDSDPMFANVDSNDYALKKESPCINAGSTDTTGLKLGTNDITGSPRISENRIDIGAFEHPNNSSSISSFVNRNNKAPAILRIQRINSSYQIAVTIPCGYPRSFPARMYLCTIQGRKILDLYNGILSPGTGMISFSTKNTAGRILPPGPYLCILAMGEADLRAQKIYLLD